MCVIFLKYAAFRPIRISRVKYEPSTVLNTGSSLLRITLLIDVGNLGPARSGETSRKEGRLLKMRHQEISPQISFASL
jgi:hypothetical protein